ncbi:MAG TPA: DNA polymerase III subunit beta [Candidatus Krumholzibacteria bacterium]|nr:DNA polymerase III subunit beta [Candidatus Krumholzibacteria bacterium]HPD73010.1 DNA polymerase III subunit beta [Candidatus Krumholzibacteria bacterium]HRY41809.1 DNA polymerase III subunit beta [Candidatus Krumholzibacteria bacterium]
MKFEIQQEALQKALDLVAGVVPSKTTLPILRSILVEAEASALRFSVTNLDISMVTVTGDVEIAEPGKAAVLAEKLTNFVRSLAPGSVQVTVTGGRLFIRAGKAALEESCLNPDEFPAFPSVIEGDGLAASGDALTAMIGETIYSVSRDETRPALMGILWEVSPEGLTMVATDAHRLARSRRKFEWDNDETRSMIVDTAGLRQLSRVVAQAGETPVEIFLGQTQLSFRAGPTVLHTRLLEGPFPDYNAVIPKGNDRIVTVDRETLAQAIRRVSITADRITSQIRLGLEKDRLELSAKGSDGSRAEDEVTVGYRGKAMEIGFNYTYLIDILKNMRVDAVQLSLRDPQSAALITPIGEDGAVDDSLLCLLMPLRLASD